MAEKLFHSTETAFGIVLYEDSIDWIDVAKRKSNSDFSTLELF